MNPKKKSFTKKNVSKVPSTPVKEDNKFLNYMVWILKNVIAGIICYVLVLQCIEEQKGYNWVYNSLLKGNYEMIKKNPNLTIDQKWAAKLGFNYAYWKHINDNTPEDAVILYPIREAFFPKDKETQFTSMPENVIFASRFLYPRKIVSPSEIETNPYGKQITHVAIVNGWGYDYLEYDVPSHTTNHVLPIKQPEQQQISNQSN